MKSHLTAAAVLAVTSLASAAMAQPQLTPEQREQFVAHIRQADANHDGMITRAEYLNWRASRFDSFDRNHDGFIDASDAPRFAAHARERLNLLMSEADTNHDGRISRAEFNATPTPLFDQADRDHNGVLDPLELTALGAK